MRSTSRFRRWLCWSPSAVRAVSVSAAVVIVAVTILSAHRTVRASYTNARGSAVETRVHGGLVEFWWHNPRSNAYWADMSSRPAPRVSSFDFGIDREWGDSISLAWRPYHIASSRWPSPSSHHAAAIPLWMAVVPMLLLAGYSHGVVVGNRRGAKGRCTGCGYSRSGLTVEAACPECGVVPPETR